jgi:hypothetical protein
MKVRNSAMTATVESDADRFSLPEVATIMSEPRHIVDHAIRSAGIEPRQWAANARLFSRDQFPAIREALARNASNRRGAARERFIDTARVNATHL